MNPKIKAVVESYVRAFIVALGVAYSDGLRGADEILIAAAIAVAGPAIRALNPNDAMFGLVADTLDAEVKTLVKKSAAKKKTK